MEREGLNIQQMQQIEQAKRQVLSQVLTKEAFERLGRVRTVNPQLASQAELYILQIYQTGRLKQRITDEKMRDVLGLLSERKEFSIKRG